MEMALKLADFSFEKLITVKMSMSCAYYSLNTASGGGGGDGGGNDVVESYDRSVEIN